MKKTLSFMLSVVFMFAYCVSAGASGITPQLKYTNKGTYSTWTEESYYSSPAIDDIDGDGKLEIIFSNYSITVLDAATGTTKWKVNSGRDRSMSLQEYGASNGHTWSDVEIADINGDGAKEIITGHGGGVISVLSADGYFLPGWPQTPANVSVRSIEVADLDGDGFCEIVAGVGYDGPKSVYVYNYDGTLRSGWPQLLGEATASTWLHGVFMDTIAIDDLNNDGIMEIIVPSDEPTIAVFEPDGSFFRIESGVYAGKNWGTIGYFEDYDVEMRIKGGWEITGTTREYYESEFGHAKAKVVDVDGDGTKEVVVSLLMTDEHSPKSPKYMSVAILNADRSRYKNEELGYDWEMAPTDLGEPLCFHANMFPSYVYQSPTIDDIDGDGKNEILFNSFNGKVHCFSLEKKEPYAWPYSMTTRTSPMYEYASPVACADVDFDGKKEIIFTSFYDPDQGYGITRGYLYILNYEGKLISKTQLPTSKESGRLSNGSMAEPKVCDIDGDGRYEVVINTLTSGICAYDL